MRAVRAQGKGMKSIAHLFEARGIPCRGQRWQHTTVRSIPRRDAQLFPMS
jgi:hypothetical protein